MRIIAGSAKGRKLAASPGLHTRPTADRIKETMFNILTPYLFDAVVLDLFGGTGALGIEALSRGAAHAVFVEWDKPGALVIAKNLQGARLTEKARLMEMDAFLALERLVGRLQFDLIFLDPPYGQGLIQAALRAILAGNLLKDTGIIVTEQGSDEETVAMEALEVSKTKQYKTMKLVFYKMREA